MGKKASVLMIAVLSMSTMLMAQSGRSEVSVDYGANFSKESDGNQLAQVPTTSGGFLAGYQYALSHYGSVELSYGFTRNSQNFTIMDAFTGFQSSESVQTNVHQITAAVVIKRNVRKLNPFVLAGSGVLLFSPTDTANNASLGASTQTKPVFLYGGG